MDCAGRSQSEWHTVWVYGMDFIEALHAHLFDAIALSAYAAIGGCYGSKEHSYAFSLTSSRFSCVASVASVASVDSDR